MPEKPRPISLRVFVRVVRGQEWIDVPADLSIDIAKIVPILGERALRVRTATATALKGAIVLRLMDDAAEAQRRKGGKGS